MTLRAAVLALILLGVVAAVSAAQTPPAPALTLAPPEPPGPYVIDVRGSTVGTPQAVGFYPSVPTGTLIPSRAFGLDLGAHIYLFRLGRARVGLGADLFRLRGTAAPPAPAKSTTGTTPIAAPSAPTTPDIKATITTVAPQLSLNYGSATGWSYLSAGLGRAPISSERSAFDKGTAESRESGQLSSVNFGGGARWFTSGHLAFTFDIRFHLLSAGKSQEIAAAAGVPGTAPSGTVLPATVLPGTPRTRIVSASVGVSLR